LIPVLRTKVEMKHKSDKMTIAPMSSEPCGKVRVGRCFDTNS
jgi:hypothetical protein